MRNIVDVIELLRTAIKKNGQLTSSLSNGFDSFIESDAFCPPEQEMINELWDRLVEYLGESFDKNNPHVSEYKRIFAGPD